LYVAGLERQGAAAREFAKYGPFPPLFLAKSAEGHALR